MGRHDESLDRENGHGRWFEEACRAEAGAYDQSGFRAGDIFRRSFSPVGPEPARGAVLLPGRPRRGVLRHHKLRRRFRDPPLHLDPAPQPHHHATEVPRVLPRHLPEHAAADDHRHRDAHVSVVRAGQTAVAVGHRGNRGEAVRLPVLAGAEPDAARAAEGREPKLHRPFDRISHPRGAVAARLGREAVREPLPGAHPRGAGGERTPGNERRGLFLPERTHPFDPEHAGSLDGGVARRQRTAGGGPRGGGEGRRH
mmetsp:Transcript_14421/g.36030  ORF Transcript_14421/g.36030 Transcript_14421/m.36030 type:complete len:255 (-) Transcript_14421:1455-2219(-)